MPRPKKRLKKKIKKLKKPRAALHSETKKGIVVVVCFTLALITLLSYFHQAGALGEYFLRLTRSLFGQGFFLIPLGLILAGLAILKSFKRPAYQSTFAGLILFILALLGIFYVLALGSESPIGRFAPQTSGGYLGLILGYPLLKFLGFWASLIVCTALLIVAILVMFNLALPRLVRRKETEIKREEKEKEKVVEKIEEKPSLLESVKRGLAGIKKAEPEIKIGKGTFPGDTGNVPFKAAPLKTFSKFKLPSLDLLEADKGQPTSGDIKANLNIIKRTLEDFGIEVEMAEVNVGPTVTQYTLRPAQGVKLSRITALHNDLSLALAAHPIRIEAPIPGRSLVGIEIPNRSVILVRLANLLKTAAFQEASSPLTFALGRDVAGQPVFADLAQMPHLLIAGATGTGKTIALNSLMTNLLYQNSPEMLKLILVDPKRVEFGFYNGIPHLLTPAITQADKTINALRWAVGEMEHRFELLEEVGARDIMAYNKVLGANIPKNLGDSLPKSLMPYIVIVIDELADLMASRGREVEAAIVRLAQMARAVGMHLVVSTQRPSVEVITGLIKANITSRMAFQVASQVDSRTILDMAGAEKLLGNGDMLYLAGDVPKPRRIQGTYISDKEVKKLTGYLKKVQEPDYEQAVLEHQRVSSLNDLSTDFGLAEADDELYQEAKEVIFQAGKASASLLQRRLRIGYARAARLLDMMEERGVVGPADGAKPREVFGERQEEV